MHGGRATPLFYGWWIVTVAFVVSAGAWSTRASFAVVYAAMLADLGWSRTDAVLGYALSWLVLVGFGPLAGWLYDRLGPRLVVPAGGLALALGEVSHRRPAQSGTPPPASCAGPSHSSADRRPPSSPSDR